MRPLVAILFILALLPATAAASVNFFENNIEIGASDVRVTVSMTFDRVPVERLEYPLLYQIDDFKYSSNFQEVTCDALRRSWGTAIICDFKPAGGAGKTLGFSFKTADLTRVIEQQRLFSTTVRVPELTEKMVVRTYLAPGFILAGGDGALLPRFTPVDGESNSDGKRIFVLWTRSNVSRGEGLDISVSYERVVPEQNALPLLIVGGIGLLILIVLVVVAVRRRPSQPKMNITLLKPDERRVVDIVTNHGGVVRQRAIVEATGYSKAKVSRLIHDLQERGVLEVRGQGRTNEVKLASQKPKEEPKEEPKTSEEKKEPSA